MTGTSGILSHSIYIYLNVVGPDFTISVNPYVFNVEQGQMPTLRSTITLTSFYGLTGNVTLSVSPGGLSASLSKTSLILTSGGTASANLTITVPAYASLGYHYVNLQAVNGSIVRTATVYVYVYPAPTPDFSISIVPSSETLIAGTTGNYSVILTSQNGFSGTVGLNATSTNGFTTVFNPQKLTVPTGGQVSASLAITVPSSTLTGFYYILVIATNSTGTPVHSIYVGANVLAQNFTLAVVPTAVTVQAGSTGKSIVDAVGLNGFSGTVQLTLTYKTQQITASLGTTTLEITSGFANSTVLTISTSISTAPGTYQVVVNGTIGSLSRVVTVTVYVTPSLLQPTSTTVACSTPVKVNETSTCTATVMSMATSGVTTPSGRVDFTTNSTSTFFTSYCYPSGTGTTGIAKCSVSYTPTVIGHILITATFTGDAAHSPGTGNFTLTSLPNVTLNISGPTVGYTGSQIVFNVSAAGGILPFTFNWTTVGGTPSTGSGSSFSTAYAAAGFYAVTANATDANGNTGSSNADILIFQLGQKLGLTVQVYNSTLSPISEATVLAVSQLTTGTNSSVTDTTGISKFILAPGIYNVTASSPGYLSDSQIVDLLSNTTITLTLATPLIFLGQIPASHMVVQEVTGGFNITLTNMFAKSGSNVFFDWKFTGTIPANSTQTFFYSQLPNLIVESAAKGTGDYPYAWYAEPAPIQLVSTTGKEGAFLAESNPYDASSIFIIPNPPTPGKNTVIGVTLHDPFNYTLHISRIDFQIATLNIGANTWQSVGYISNVTLAVGETRTFTVNWVATLSSHLCVRVVLSYSPANQTLQKNFVFSNSISFILGNPTQSGQNVTLVVPIGCQAFVNGRWITGPVIIFLSPGQLAYAIIVCSGTGIHSVGEYINGQLVGGFDVYTSAGPDVQIVCPPDGLVGEPITCSANVTGDISAWSFLWSTDGNPATGTDSIFTTSYSTPGLHTVTLTATTSGSPPIIKTAQILIHGNTPTVLTAIVVSSPGTTGSSAYDTATVNPANTTGPIPTGQVVYDFYSSALCSGSASSETVSLRSDGSVPDSSPHGSLAAGNYSFRASYLGDANNPPAPSNCEDFIIEKAPATVTTQVINDGTGLAPSGNEVIGASFHDTAMLKGTVTGLTPTGTVSYALYTTMDCTGPSTSLSDVSLNPDGSVPDSGSTGTLHAGNYSFTATYNGDSNYLKSPASSCEPFMVNRAPTTVTTLVISDATGLAPFGTEVTGASFHDSALLGGAVIGFIPTGSLTYSLYATGDCSGIPAKSVNAVVLTADGAVPDSATTGPLGAGTYSYNATYSGDHDYLSSTLSSCESFFVLKAPTTVTTMLINAATGGIPSGTEVTGASFSDNATLHGAIVGFTPGGDVRYRFWTNGSCTGTGTSETFALTIMGGALSSSATGPLGAGTYSLQADYSGDKNYLPSISSCEQFTVLKAPTTTHSQVINSATHAAPTGAEVAGASFYDTSTVTGIAGFTPTGPVNYEFFKNGVCSGSSSTATVTLSGGLVPNSPSTVSLGAGGYSYIAVYSGDGNYTGSTSSSPSCESFNVGKAKPTVLTTLVPSGPVKAGQSVTDQASFVFNTAFNPTGMVTYTLTPSGTCTGPGSRVVSVVTISAGSIPSSGTVLLNTAGTFGFNATYSGDGNNTISMSSCEAITVNKATPSITTSLSSSSINVQSSAFDSATLSGTSGSNAGGTVTYTLFLDVNGAGTGGCTSTASTVSIVNVTNGIAPPSRLVFFNRTGTYGWNARYSGDSNNNGTMSSCELLTVNTPARPPGVPYFTLTAVPASVSVSAGTKGNSTIVLHSFNGLARPVYLAFSVAPSTGLTCTLSRSRITGGLGNSTLSCAGSTGVYAVNVTGTSGPQSRSVIVRFNMTSTFGPANCGSGCSAFILSDAILSNISGSSTSINFTATGLSGTTAFSNVTIPVSAVPAISALQVLINGTAVPAMITSDSTNYSVYFTFTFHSTLLITVQLTA